VGVQTHEVNAVSLTHWFVKGLRSCSPFFMALLIVPNAHALELQGQKKITLHANDGSSLVIGTVTFTAADAGRTAFKISLDHSKMADHFLSMREFKCASGQGEILCHVPYPYAQPGTATTTDLAWLEHALLFMFKLPNEFGAKLWNGVYFQLQATDQALVGTAQAVDLNQIGSPPARLDVPPYSKTKRDEIREGARWFERLTIQ
jgi:hypothetical protein